MLETLNNIDTKAFLFLNGMHNTFFDFLMYWISDRLIWIPLYVFLLYLVIKEYRRQWWLILVLIAILITMSDQLTVFLKNNFERPRPCHKSELQLLVHIVKDHCGGRYGFVSSHASNSFSLAVFLIPFFKNKYSYFTLLILFWAGLVAYSRIYLGVHFPGDVLAGACIGGLLGYLLSKIYFLLSSSFLKTNKR